MKIIILRKSPLNFTNISCNIFHSISYMECSGRECSGCMGWRQLNHYASHDSIFVCIKLGPLTGVQA